MKVYHFIEEPFFITCTSKD